MLLVTLLTLAALETPQQSVLRTPIGVWDVTVEDLNQDGRNDILLLVSDPDSDPLVKGLRVHLAGEAGAYAEAASSALTLPAEIGAVFLAEYDGAAPREVVAVYAAGARVYQWQDNALTEIAAPRFNSLFPSYTTEPKIIQGLAQDLDRDGRDEWLIPQPTGFEVRRGDEARTLITCDVVSSVSRDGDVRISHRLPALQAFDVEGYDTQVLSFLSDEFADFAFGPGWEQHYRYAVPVNLEEKWEASAALDDINADGFPDLVVTQMRGTANIEAVTQVYMAEAPFQYPEEPNATFTASGAIASPGLRDVDGDGLKDIIFVRIPFGVGNFINFFVRGKLGIEADVYLYNDGFGDEPDFDTSFSLEAPDGREEIAYVMADFNGDGRLDAAFGDEADQLDIHLGEEDNFLSRRPVMELSLPSFGTARHYDLNGNANQDIVLFHPSGANQTRVEVVVF